MIQYLILSAITPSLFLMWYFYRRDRNREPQKIIWATFLLGIVTVIPVLLVDEPISAFVETLQNPYLKNAGNAFLVAAFPEEFFKYLVVVLFAMRRRAFDEPMDGIVYGAIASLGFATLENILYVSQGGLGLALLRALTAVPAHACFGAIMGYFVGQYRFSTSRKWWLLLLGYFVPVLLHGLYDFPLMALKVDAENHVLSIIFVLTTLTVLVTTVTVAVRLVRKIRKDQDASAALLEQTLMTSFATPQASVVMEHQGLMFHNPSLASVSPLPVLAQTPVPAKNRFLSMVLLLVGGLFGALGGLVLLGLCLNAFEQKTRISDAIFAGIIAGVFPLFLGIFMFRKGLLRLRSRQQAGSASVQPNPTHEQIQA